MAAELDELEMECADESILDAPDVPVGKISGADFGIITLKLILNPNLALLSTLVPLYFFLILEHGAL